jgi:hypothetical protein
MLQSILPKVGKASKTTVTILSSIAKLPYLSEIVAILFWPDLTIVIRLKLFKKDGKASIISHLWNIHLKLIIFEVDYMVLMCLAQKLTFWKIRKKIWLLFWLIWEKFGGFLKKNLATLLMSIQEHILKKHTKCWI